MRSVIDEVSRTTIQLILKEPFYGHFLSGMLKELSEEVNTIAVGSSDKQLIRLYINEQFWLQGLRNAEERYGVIKHEVLHIVLKHIFQINDFDNKKIFNISADLVVNQYIDPRQLPGGAILLGQFPELKLRPYQDVGYYYRALLKAWRQQQQGRKAGEADSPGSSSVLDELMNGPNEQLEKHRLWEKSLSKLHEADRRILEGALDQVLEATVNRLDGQHIGKLPGSLKNYLQGYLTAKAPKVNWRRMLRLFAAGSRRTFLKETIQRPSKRYGTTPGIKVKRRHRLLVAIDTSGSIREADLQIFFSEIYHIWRQGIEIRVVECDVKIHKEYFYRGVTPEFVMGRGGTAFDEPIRYANEAYPADALVYFTDGMGAAPRIKSRKPVLWMITHNGITEDSGFWKALPGRKVKMNN